MVEEAKRISPSEGKLIRGETYRVLDCKDRGPFDHGYFGDGAHFFINFENSPHLQECYRKVTASSLPTDDSEKVLLGRVKDVVREAFPPQDYFDVTRFAIELTKEKGGGAQSLDEYVKAGMGFCAHTALTAGILLERLKKNGLLAGDVSLDSFYLNLPEADYDGHQWCTYRTSEGETYVIDPTEDFVGIEEDYELVKRRIMAGIVWTVD